MRWVEGEKAVGGGGEGDDVVAQGGGTQLGEFFVLVEKIGRNATHHSLSLLSEIFEFWWNELKLKKVKKKKC